jgi:probable phosphoglycerate mutase
MTTFVLIRHASHDLLGHTLVGRAPGVGLSAQGARDAGELAQWLEAAPIRAVYSSPLERARETAAIVATRLQLQVRIADELNEIDFGEWTDRRLGDLHELVEWQWFNAFRSTARTPNGEAMIDVQSRMLQLIERLGAVHADQMVALVSHGDVIKATLAHYLGVPLDLLQRIEVSPASVSVVRVERYGPQVLLVNGLVEFLQS